MIKNIEYIVVVYRNRTETIRLHQSLNKMRIKNSVIPTPNQIFASCGLSIKLRYCDINKVLFCINSNFLSQNYQIYGERIGLVGTNYTKLK